MRDGIGGRAVLLQDRILSLPWPSLKKEHSEQESQKKWQPTGSPPTSSHSC